MKHYCNYPGCPAILDKGRYCHAHKDNAPKRHTIYDRHVRAKDTALAIAQKIRSSRKWGNVRRHILANQPICTDPFGDHARAGITRTSQQVHHIKGLATHPHLWNVQSNLQALCTACHARIEREHRTEFARDPEPSGAQQDGSGPAFG
jgi:5-methylcytosine-specific restriction endonuclease McrA